VDHGTLSRDIALVSRDVAARRAWLATFAAALLSLANLAVALALLDGVR